MASSSQIMTISKETLQIAIKHLTKNDSDLKQIVIDLGLPPLWIREPGFKTLIHIILEQQVSLASARATFEKVSNAAETLTPSRLLKFTDLELRKFGFSKQKAGYCCGVAEVIIEGRLDLDSLQYMSDEEARLRLVEIKGIGPWTADIYLLMALRRSDIWPTGDLALASAMQQVKGLSIRPNQELQEEIASLWKPWRSVAARILWHYYLSGSTI